MAALACAASCSQKSGPNSQSRGEDLVSPNNAITQAADESRTGWFPDQPSLDPATVGGPNFKRLFKTALPLTPGEQVLAQPLVYGGKVLVATEANNLYLLDATTGAITNQRALGGAFDANSIGCGDISPTVGVTGAPVIDNATGTAYLYSKSDTGVWSLHAVSASDLSERAGFPVQIGGTAQNDASATFDSVHEHQRPGLLLMGGVIYAGFGAHCDTGNYRGWLFGVSTSGVVKARFATVANAGSVIKGNGIWMSGAGLSSDAAGRIFFATGNGYAQNPYPSPLPGNTPPGDLEEAVVRVDVQADASLKANDFFAPFNAQALNGGDSDLGAGGIVLLPSQFGTSA
ncbi:MAG TPA: PQQ-binding-like beta-propeller repeat protein, partial [Polyangiaceae bacterium]|nr:PQQ-binding-like beta-propeller repeat protein [Polyangiaceae bacterium]